MFGQVREVCVECLELFFVKFFASIFSYFPQLLHPIVGGGTILCHEHTARHNEQKQEEEVAAHGMSGLGSCCVGLAKGNGGESRLLLYRTLSSKILFPSSNVRVSSKNCVQFARRSAGSVRESVADGGIMRYPPGRHTHPGV